MVVNLIEWSDKFMEAEKQREGIEPLTEQLEHFTLKDAYSIQLEVIHKKVIAGDQITGKKIGLTSEAMQKLLKVDEPDYGHLLESMELKNNELDCSECLKPRVEAEVAFVMKEDLKGPNVTAEDVINATDYVLASIEVVDSRIKNWNIKLLDTIADNASSAKYVLGEKKRTLDEIDLPAVHMDFYKNGELINSGKGSDVLGNPASCVAWLVNKLADFNIGLKKGEIVLSGALSSALDAAEGDIFVADFGDTLGKVELICR